MSFSKVYIVAGSPSVFRATVHPPSSFWDAVPTGASTPYTVSQLRWNDISGDLPKSIQRHNLGAPFSCINDSSGTEAIFKFQGDPSGEQFLKTNYFGGVFSNGNFVIDISDSW